jgi:hypothetical protein
MTEDTITTYVVIAGNHTSTKSVVDYVAHIVYGNPRIDAVEVGSHFVAICEFAPSQATAARYTFDRMGSFPHGASFHWEKVSALTEFGTLVYQWAPGTIVGLSEAVKADQSMVADMEAEGLL